MSSAEEELVVASEGEKGFTGERGPHVRIVLLVTKEGRAALRSSRRLFRCKVTELSVREVFEVGVCGCDTGHQRQARVCCMR